MLDWLKRAPTAPPTPPDPSLRELVLITRQELTELKTDLQGIRMEWADTLSKINRWAAKEAARQRRALEASLPDDGEQPVPDPASDEDRGAEGKLALWRRAQGRPA